MGLRSIPRVWQSHQMYLIPTIMRNGSLLIPGQNIVLANVKGLPLFGESKFISNLSDYSVGKWQRYSTIYLGSPNLSLTGQNIRLANGKGLSLLRESEFVSTWSEYSSDKWQRFYFGRQNLSDLVKIFCWQRSKVYYYLLPEESVFTSNWSKYSAGKFKGVPLLVESEFVSTWS